MYSLSKRSLSRMEGVDPRLIEIAKRAIEITKIDFGIPGDGGLRTAERQFELFQEGRSKADGFTKKSYHQTGKALDFYAYVDGTASWSKEHLAQVACAFLQAAGELGYKLQWGGLFRTFQDMPHIQIVD